MFPSLLSHMGLVTHTSYLGSYKAYALGSELILGIWFTGLTSRTLKYNNGGIYDTILMKLVLYFH